MFTTVNEVKEITGYDVTKEVILQAQTIIESYVGRTEVDVQSASDMMLLGRATAYQSAYMVNDETKIFEQVSATQVMQFGQMTTFDPNSAAPFVAPLAAIACKGLSWKKIRSIKTGSIFHTPPVEEGWRRD